MLWINCFYDFYQKNAFMIDADNKHLQKGNWKDIGVTPTIRSSMLKLVYTTLFKKKKKKKVDWFFESQQIPLGFAHKMVSRLIIVLSF